MIKNFLFFVIPIILIPYSFHGFAEIENKEINAKSINEDVILFLEIGENQFSNFQKPVLFLKYGSLVLGDRIMEIENSRLKIMGNSFVVHSDDILIYAKVTDSGKYRINCYIIGENKLEHIELISFQEQNNQKKIDEISSKIDLIVLVQQDIRTYWNDTYDLSVKVFDKSINPNPQFYQSLGAIEQADVAFVMKDSEGNEIKRIMGRTNSKGFWEMSYFIPQNIIPGGSYNVELNVDYKEAKNFQNFKTFIVGDTRASDSSN